MKIKGLTPYELGWEWLVIFEEDDNGYDDRFPADRYPNVRICRTNRCGEGLWMEREVAWNIQADRPYTEMKQIEGTYDFSLMGYKTYNSAYKRIRRYFK